MGNQLEKLERSLKKEIDGLKRENEALKKDFLLANSKAEELVKENEELNAQIVELQQRENAAPVLNEKMVTKLQVEAPYKAYTILKVPNSGGLCVMRAITIDHNQIIAIEDDPRQDMRFVLAGRISDELEMETEQ